MMAVKDPDQTRKKILEVAMEEIHARGFQAASLNQIVEKTGLSKDAFYHHFKTKNELGYSIVDQVVRESIREMWLKPLQEVSDPIDAIIQTMERAKLELSEEEVCKGCPLNNLSQEMSNTDEKFRQLIQSVYEEWIEGTEQALKRAIVEKSVREDINPKSTATFIVATLEGTIGLGKNFGGHQVMELVGEGMFLFLNSLRRGKKQNG